MPSFGAGTVSGPRDCSVAGSPPPSGSVARVSNLWDVKGVHCSSVCNSKHWKQPTCPSLMLLEPPMYTMWAPCFTCIMGCHAALEHMKDVLCTVHTDVESPFWAWRRASGKEMHYSLMYVANTKMHTTISTGMTCGYITLRKNRRRYSSIRIL